MRPNTGAAKLGPSLAAAATLLGCACLLGCASVLGIEELEAGPRPGADVSTQPVLPDAGARQMSDASAGSAGADVERERPLFFPDASSIAGNPPADSGAEPAPVVDAGPEPPATIAVQGRLIDFFRRPVPNQPVTIGDETTLTAQDGSFSFSDVLPPYDVSTSLSYQRFGGTNRYGYVYEGLTRPDPTIQVYRALPARDSDVVVQFGDVEFSNGEFALFAFSGPDGYFTNTGRNSDVILLGGASWAGPVTMSGNVHALKLVRGSGTLAPPTAFTSYETLPLALTANQDTPLELSLPEQDIPSALVAGSVVPSQSVNRSNIVSLVFSDGTRLPIAEELVSSEAFSYLVPNLPGAAVQVAAVEDDIAPFALAHTGELAPGAENIGLTIPRPVTLASPGAGAVVTPETTFSWSGLAQTASTYVWHLEFTQFYQGMFVITSREQIEIPSFADGLDVPPGTQAYWSVETHGDQPTVDTLAGPDGFLDTFAGDRDSGAGPSRGAGYFTESERRSFMMAE